MKHKAAIGVLMVALMMALVVTAQAAVELYEVKASAYVPAFIDYKLNCTADVTIQIRPSDASGVPTGAAIKTVTFTGQSRGFHRFIWLADIDGGGIATVGDYVAELTATSNQAQWDPIIGLYTVDDWTHEYSPRPLPSTSGSEGFYGVAVNCYPGTGKYYGRIYATHKTQKDVFMYGPDGAYLGKFDDSKVTWGTSAPWDITVADDGYVYVCDRSNMLISCFDPDGKFMSTSPATTNHRAIFARTAADGTTYIAYSGSTQIKRIWVKSDHITWQTSPYGGNNLFACAGAGDYGMWMSQDLNTIYVAAIGGAGAGADGTTKWVNNAGTWAQAAGFTKRITASGDVSLVDAPGTTPDYLWITRQVAYVADNPTTTQNEAVRALYKDNASTNAVIASTPYDVISWGLMNSADSVGNVAVTFGKATATWAQWYWGLFAEAGTYTTSVKRTASFHLGETPSPVVVPGTAVWTADNTIAADNSDSASVSFKVMDVDGWQDITNVTLDLQPLGYGSAETCTIAPDPSDAAGKTAIATKAGIRAKVGTRCTTSFGQPVHYLTATPIDHAGGGYADATELQLNVTGDPYFDANIRHRRVNDWYIDGAQIMAVGGGIPGATDPRAKGPFTYKSAPSSTAGYASLEMSAGTFQVKATKVGFGSENPIGVTVPYTGYTVDLYLRPLTVAEVRDSGNAISNGTKVNVEAVCYAESNGYNRTVTPAVLNVYGLAARTDTLIKRNQWYGCDPNSPLNGMLFMITEPSGAFVPQWDDPAGADDFDNSTYIGPRPLVGQTIMVTGILDTPGGHERRILIQDADITTALGKANENLDPAKIYPVFMNRGNQGGLPTPSAKPLSYFNHAISAGMADSWGNFIQTDSVTVVRVQADGTETGVTSGDPIPYVVVADTAGNCAQIAFDMPASLNVTSLPTFGSTYTFKGSGSRRTRFGGGALRVRNANDIAFVADNYDENRPTVDVGAVRTANSGDPVKISGQVVAKIGNTMWLEKDDRSIGVRVMANPSYVAVKDVVTVYGNFQLMDGEMVVVPSIPVFLPSSTATSDIAAFDMRSRELGGNASGTTPGVATGRGALNVGLKAHFLGMVTAVDPATAPQWYYVWDGANRSDAAVTDGSGNIGVLVEAAPPTGTVAWQTTVDITGMVSTKDLGGGNIAPTIVPTSQTKVTTFDAVHADAGTALVGSWNLMSIPVAPAAAGDGDEYSAKPWDPFQVVTPSKVPDDLDGRMYRWENCTGSLMMWDMWSEVGSHGPFGGLVLGDGYWVSLSEPWAVDYTGKNSSLDEWTGICAPGWAIVGQPKDHKTLLGDLKVHDGSSVVSMYDAVINNAWVDCIGYWWDNQTQSLVDIGIDDCFCSTNTLEPWHGYWMQFYKGDLALITPETPAAP